MLDREQLAFLTRKGQASNEAKLKVRAEEWFSKNQPKFEQAIRDAATAGKWQVYVGTGLEYVPDKFQQKFVRQWIEPTGLAVSFPTAWVSGESKLVFSWNEGDE